MSGVEAVGLVTGIISAITGVYTAFTKWAKKKKERRKEPQNQALEISLKFGPSEIDSQYASYVKLLGPRFKSGDGDQPSDDFLRIEHEWLTPLIDMAIAELIHYLNQSQKALALMTQLVTLKATLLPNSQALKHDTDQIRGGTLRTLELYCQRMMQAAALTRTGLNPRFNEPQLRRIGYPARPDPLPNTQPPPRDFQAWGDGGSNPRFHERQPRPPETSVRLYPLPNMQSYPIGGVEEFCDGALEFNGSDGKWHCSNCSFQASKHGFRNTFWPLPTRDAPLLYLHSWIFLVSHLRLRSDQKGGVFPLYGCQVCPQAGHFTESDLKQHFQQHTHHQQKAEFRRSVQVCDCQAPHGRHQKFCVIKRLLGNKERELERFSSGLPLHRWMSNMEFQQH